jgi:hypothetical protein
LRYLMVCFFRCVPSLTFWSSLKATDWRVRVLEQRNVERSSNAYWEMHCCVQVSSFETSISPLSYRCNDQIATLSNCITRVQWHWKLRWF